MRCEEVVDFRVPRALPVIGFDCMLNTGGQAASGTQNTGIASGTQDIGTGGASGTRAVSMECSTLADKPPVAHKILA